MPNNYDDQDRFYGIYDAELDTPDRSQQEADYLLKSARAIRENGQDMSKIRTPRLSKMRKRRDNIKKVAFGVSLICGMAAAGWTAFYAAMNGDSNHDRAWRNEMNRRHEFDPDWQELEAPEEDWSGYGKGLVYILAPALLAIFIYLGYKKRTQNHENAAGDAARMMLDWRELGTAYPFDEKQLKAIMNDRFARDVIAGMSEAESVWFEMLLDGDIEIAETPEFKNMATAIMRRHLEKHPEAIERILEKFDQNSIPNEFVSNYVPKPKTFER